MSLRDQLKAEQARPAPTKSKVAQLLDEHPEDSEEILDAMLDPEIQHRTIFRYLKETYDFDGNETAVRRFRKLFGQLVQEGSK